MPFEHAILRGRLHAFVAFDWADEIDLDHARRLLPAETQDLARRRRTPSSIGYRPAPLRYPLGSVKFELPGYGSLEATAEAIVFDFGGVSVSLQVSIERAANELRQLAACLAESQPVIEAARQVATELFNKLQGAMQQPRWSPLVEEYFVFELPPGGPLPPTEVLLSEHADWLASLVRLEGEPLSGEEVNAAVQSRISYSPADMLLADWSAAVLIDRDCEETLQAIEFANLQLLEYRYIDNLLDDRLAAAYSTLHRTVRSWLPFWRTQGRSLRYLGELRLDVNRLFERTGNALKLVGDQYLARVYRLVAGRLHLADWEHSIRSSLDVVEGAYQVLSDQSASLRIELLEVIVIILIGAEIVMAMVRH